MGEPSPKSQVYTTLLPALTVAVKATFAPNKAALLPVCPVNPAMGTSCTSATALDAAALPLLDAIRVTV